MSSYIVTDPQDGTPNSITPVTDANLERLSVMGVWQWIEEVSPGDSDRRHQAKVGRNWLLMPYREIALVHAVQRPLAAPAMPEIPTERRRARRPSPTPSRQ